MNRNLVHRGALLSALYLVLAGLVLLPMQATAQAGNAGHCHGVQFDVLFYLNLDDEDYFAVGEIIAGDLEGHADIQLLGGTDPTGRTNTVDFRWEWHITGGAIPGLIGQSFVTVIENRNLNGVPPRRFDPSLGMAVGRHEVESGASFTNLTYIGEAKPSTEYPPFTNLLHHRGVICF